MRVATGTYTGNGSSQSITGLPFAPALVLVQMGAFSGTYPLTLKTSAMAGDLSHLLAFVTAPHALTDGITSLNADGFSVGSNTYLNSNTAPYYWVAFGSDASALGVGSYVGDGIDNHDVTDVGFQPDFVLICSNLDSGNDSAGMRFVGQTGSNSLRWYTGGEYTTGIKAFLANGFSLGTNVVVNESGRTYYYIALKAKAGNVYASSFVGNGFDNRDIVQGDAFLPAWVLVKNRDATGGGFVHRTPDMVGDLSARAANQWQGGALTTDFIQQLNSDGFQVGTNLWVNQGGVTVYYMAVKDALPYAPPLLMNARKLQERGMIAPVLSY